NTNRKVRTQGTVRIVSLLAAGLRWEFRCCYVNGRRRLCDGSPAWHEVIPNNEMSQGPWRVAHISAESLVLERNLTSFWDAMFARLWQTWDVAQPIERFFGHAA